jgi:hypothetical protein
MSTGFSKSGDTLKVRTPELEMEKRFESTADPSVQVAAKPKLEVAVPAIVFPSLT